MMDKEDKKLKVKESKLINKIWKNFIDNKNVWLLFTTGLLFMGIFLTLLVTGANKVGVSQEELDHKIEAVGSEDFFKEEHEGHLGGEEILIREKLENNVEVEEFKDFLAENPDVYVYYYSPYCPYCASSWEETLTALKDSGVDYITVDVNREVDFQDEEEILTVPQLVRYKDGNKDDSLTGVVEDKDMSNFLGDKK